MKTFTFEKGIVQPGLALQEDVKYGPVVFLGSVGNGCHFDRVSLARGYPPQIQNMRVHEADLKEVILTTEGHPQQGRSFHVLENSPSGQSDFLVRVDTRPMSLEKLELCQRPSIGGWLMEGERLPRDKICGFELLKPMFKRWYDGLFIFSPGNALAVWIWDGEECRDWELVHDGGTLAANPF